MSGEAASDRMYCEIYRCHMSVRACIARQKNAHRFKNGQLNWAGASSAGAMDINCQDCEQGRKVMAAHRPEEGNMKPQEKTEKPEKPDKKWRICKEKDCEFAGEPQPIENFKVHPRFKDKRYGICSTCLARRQTEGQRARRAQNIAEAMVRISEGRGTMEGVLEKLLEGLPEVLDNIRRAAKVQERTPVGQVRYFLKTDHRISSHKNTKE